MRSRLSERLLALALAGALLLNYPLLSLYADGGNVAGLPILFVYLFAVWAGIIAAVAVLVGGLRKTQDERDDG